MPRFVRCLICLLLVLVLAIGPPLRAQASATATASLGVVGAPLLPAIGWILLGLGVVALGTLAFDALCESIAADLPETAIYYSNGVPYLKILQHGSDYYVDEAVVSDVLDGVYAHGGLIASVSCPAIEGLLVDGYDLSYGFNVFSKYAVQYDCHYLTVIQYYSGNYFRWIASPGGVYMLTYPDTEQVGFYSIGEGMTYYMTDAGGSSRVMLEDDYGYKYDISNVHFVETYPIVWSYTSTLYEIRNLGLTLGDDAYASWMTGVIASPGVSTGDDVDEEDKTHYLPWENPAVDPSDYANTGLDTGDFVNTGDFVDIDTGSLSNSGAGAGTGADTGTQAPAGWFEQVLTAVAAIPVAIADTIAAVFVPSEPLVLEDFFVDLTSFFPFCIPFDIFYMMECLDAEPVAPVFTFAVPLPGGELYEFDIDLSVWDEVAEMFRFFQVALFILALLVATGKFVRW